jgi:hypothetical protein
MKSSVSRGIELLVGAGPFAHSRVDGQPDHGTGGVSLGVQGVVHQGEGAQPTTSLTSLLAAENSALLLVSADVKGFHYDTNFLFNDVSDNEVHRAQFGQTLSISRRLGKNFGLSGEIWHFTQPLWW